MFQRVMEELMDYSSLDSGHQEVQDLDLQQLTNKIKELMDSQLHNHYIMKLDSMHKSSFYLDIQPEVLPPAEHQTTLSMSYSTMWLLIERQRLAQALSLAKTQVKLLLTMLGLLTEQLFKSYRKLSTFMEKHKQGFLSRDESFSVQQTVEQILQYATDFENRIRHHHGRMNLQTKLIPNIGDLPLPRLITSLIIKPPVMIDRSASYVTSSSVHVFWYILGEKDQESNELFKVVMKILHPTTSEDKFSSTTSKLHLKVENLTPDRHYQLSVKRVDSENLVYELWSDSIIMKTLKVTRSKVKV